MARAESNAGRSLGYIDQIKQDKNELKDRKKMLSEATRRLSKVPGGFPKLTVIEFNPKEKHIVAKEVKLVEMPHDEINPNIRFFVTQKGKLKKYHPVSLLSPDIWLDNLVPVEEPNKNNPEEVKHQVALYNSAAACINELAIGNQTPKVDAVA